MNLIPNEAEVGDKPASAYVVQLPWPFANAKGEWDDKRSFPCTPIGLADARALVAELLGPGNDWPSVRIIKRTEEMVG